MSSSASSLVLDAHWFGDGVWRVVGPAYGDIGALHAEQVEFDTNVPDYPPEHWHNKPGTSIPLDDIFRFLGNRSLEQTQETIDKILRSM
jgi:hypothetical protein